VGGTALLGALSNQRRSVQLNSLTGGFDIK
jgi:hypothetical protein